MRFNELKIFENILNEIKMSPTNLRNIAQSLDATIGIEYEFVYKSEEAKDLSIEIESMDQVILFFSKASNLDVFRKNYNKWRNDIFNEEYPDFIEKFDYYAFRFIEETEDYTLQAYNEDVINNYEKYAKIIKKNDGPTGVYNNDDISSMDADKSMILFKITKAFLVNEINELYFEDFLKKENIRTMKDLAEKYDLSIPNKTYSDIKESLQKNFFNYVNPANSNYKFVVDDSIKTNTGEIPNPNENEIGIEVVSPPQDLQNTIIDFKKIREFIKQNGYVNETTGLHINISLTNFSPDKIDYLKLILLLGDNYILKQFDRRSNYYTKSSIDKMESALKSGWDNIDDIFTSLKKDLNQLASRYILKRNIEKNMSVNIQPDRVEFRSMGDKWIENNTVEDIINNVFRFIVVLEASMNPTKYQKEYAKKLTKLMYKKDSNKDVIKMFSNYASGIITKEKLMTFLRKRKSNRQEWQDIFDQLDDLN